MMKKILFSMMCAILLPLGMIAQTVTYTSTGGFASLPSSQDGQPCPGIPTITDVDGNTYNTVHIGTQCWMKENLRTTKYADGTPILYGNDTCIATAWPLYLEGTSMLYGDDTVDITSYWYYPNNDVSNKPIYGLLYNWTAVLHGVMDYDSNPSGSLGICPMGWHVPSSAEWMQLVDYVSSQNEYACSNDRNYIAKALASDTGWNSDSTECAIGNNLKANNVTGFNVMPAGNYDCNNDSQSGGYNAFGYCATFWSATEWYGLYGDGGIAYALDFDYPDVERGGAYGVNVGLSIRCVRD